MSGNLLAADTQALVCTVNCLGVMGKGLALAFKSRYPENFKAYARACSTRGIVVGRVFVFRTKLLLGPSHIINFPTKDDWRKSSKLSYIESGLKSLLSEIENEGITSLAIPPLGCGLGGLDWGVVKPMIVDAFSSKPDVKVLLYEPENPHK